MGKRKILTPFPDWNGVFYFSAESHYFYLGSYLQFLVICCFASSHALGVTLLETESRSLIGGISVRLAQHSVLSTFFCALGRLP
jgi:hypothetical protein